MISAGYTEPSLVFLAGTETVLTNGEGAAARLIETVGAVAAVESRDEQAFLDAIAAASGVEVEKLETITGFNYSRGREVSITLYRSRAS